MRIFLTDSKASPCNGLELVSQAPYSSDSAVPLSLALTLLYMGLCRGIGREKVMSKKGSKKDVRQMEQSVPKLIGFEYELAHYVADPECPEPSRTAAEALVQAHHEIFGPVEENGSSMVNQFDCDGFRVYKDHLHFEIASPLSYAARDLVFLHDEAIKKIKKCKAHAEKKLSRPIRVFLDGTSRHGVAWGGTHVNVSVSRQAFTKWREDDWRKLHKQWVPFLVTSIPLLGAGKCGSEKGAPPAIYQISQRADFLDRLTGLETVDSKSLINERDEVLGDPDRLARFHIIAFDVNRCPFANFLKFGITQILLALLEEDYPLRDLSLRSPLSAMQAVSRDIGMKTPIQMATGKTMTALEIQFRLAEYCSYAIEKGSSAAIVPDAGRIAELWIETITDLSRKSSVLKKRLDWACRLELIRQAIRTSGADSNIAEISDLVYGEIGGVLDDFEQSGAIETVSDFIPNLESASVNLPPREEARRQLLQMFSSKLLESDWHYLVVADDSVDGESVLIVLEDPLNERIMQIIKSTTNRRAILQMLLKNGFACSIHAAVTNGKIKELFKQKKKGESEPCQRKGN